MTSSVVSTRDDVQSGSFTGSTSTRLTLGRQHVHRHHAPDAPAAIEVRDPQLLRTLGGVGVQRRVLPHEDVAGEHLGFVRRPHIDPIGKGRSREQHAEADREAHGRGTCHARRPRP